MAKRPSGESTITQSSRKPLEVPSTSDPTEAKGRIRTRARLIEAARGVFEEKGFVKTRVDDICKAAGVAHGTYYIYFKTKEELFYAIVDAVVEARQTILVVPADYTPDIRARIRYTIEQFFDDFLQYRDWSRLVEEMAMIDDRMREIRLQIRDDFSGRVRRGIERLQQRGLADSDISARLVAESIVSMISSFAFFNLGLRPTIDIDIEEALDSLTDTWVRAIGLREASPEASARTDGGSS